MPNNNVTLTMDKDLLRAARKVALDRNTSVNQLVRDFLAQLVRESGRQQVAAERMDEFFKRHRIRIGRRTWTRQDLHER
ncbi:MAG: DUF6364 family protein [Acidobacteriia bacterium]|nr:DUF6364 family protein [Terriglobia bacterium]